MAKILIIEDEVDLAGLVKDWLEREHHLVELVNTGTLALEYLEANQYDVIILDLMLPGMDGLDICRQYRSLHGEAPILMLTARSSVEDKEMGLDVGADDYLTKPFHMKELSARIRALLRRPANVSSNTLQVQDIILDPVSCKVTKAGQEVHLLPKEFRLLELLMRHPNHVFSSEALLSRVWESETIALLDTVRGHINRLRRKLDTKGRPSIIKTMHGIGYKIETP